MDLVVQVASLNDRQGAVLAFRMLIPCLRFFNTELTNLEHVINSPTKSERSPFLYLKKTVDQGKIPYFLLATKLRYFILHVVISRYTAGLT